MELNIFVCPIFTFWTSLKVLGDRLELGFSIHFSYLASFSKTSIRHCYPFESPQWVDPNRYPQHIILRRDYHFLSSETFSLVFLYRGFVFRQLCMEMFHDYTLFDVNLRLSILKFFSVCDLYNVTDIYIYKTTVIEYHLYKSYLVKIIMKNN